MLQNTDEKSLQVYNDFNNNLGVLPLLFVARATASGANVYSRYSSSAVA